MKRIMAINIKAAKDGKNFLKPLNTSPICNVALLSRMADRIIANSPQIRGGKQIKKEMLPITVARRLATRIGRKFFL
ncbi:MAG: hypothetical protein IJU44_07470 [Kiritimatiellae bacterium]|nr:hypothetical protein [Kiritimatiellia bacterium]